jgi:hypothetical protein
MPLDPRINNAVAALIAKAPPLSPGQKSRLAALLSTTSTTSTTRVA